MPLLEHQIFNFFLSIDCFFGQQCRIEKFVILHRANIFKRIDQLVGLHIIEVDQQIVVGK